MYIMYLYGANRSTQKSFSLAYVLFIIAAALGVSHIGPPRYDKLGASIQTQFSKKAALRVLNLSTVACSVPQYTLEFLRFTSQKFSH